MKDRPIIIEQLSSARGQHSFMLAMVYPFEKYPEWAIEADDGLDILIVSSDDKKKLIELDDKAAKWGRCKCRDCGNLEMKSIQQVSEHLGEGHKIYFDYPKSLEVRRPKKVVIDI